LRFFVIKQKIINYFCCAVKAGGREAHVKNNGKDEKQGENRKTESLLLFHPPSFLQMNKKITLKAVSFIYAVVVGAAAADAAATFAVCMYKHSIRYNEALGESTKFFLGR